MFETPSYWLVASRLTIYSTVIFNYQRSEHTNLGIHYVVNKYLTNEASDDITFAYLNFDGTAANGSDRFTHKVHIHLSGIFLQLCQHLQQDRCVSLTGFC